MSEHARIGIKLIVIYYKLRIKDNLLRFVGRRCGIKEALEVAELIDRYYKSGVNHVKEKL